MFDDVTQAVLGLGLAGKIHTPSFEFDSEEVRYIHRFAPFGALVTPPLVSYTQYLVSTNVDSPALPTTGPSYLALGYVCYVSKVKFCTKSYVLQSVVVRR